MSIHIYISGYIATPLDTVINGSLGGKKRSTDILMEFKKHLDLNVDAY